MTTLHILYTSDIHGNAMPIIYGTNEEADLGLVKYATVAKHKKAHYENVLLLDNGDLIQGTPLMTHYVKAQADKENPMIGIMNQIGIDAAVIGNHEFNFGRQILEDAVQQSSFPWLAANILDQKTGQPYFGTPYKIKRFPNDLTVAIIGVTTHYIPNWEKPVHIAGIQFADAKATLQKWVDHIHLVEKPDLVIASYHGGIERDLISGEPTEQLTGENQGYAMAAEIQGIDVLLTGHQHRVFTGMINDCLVIQPGNNGKMYGEITITFDQSEKGWKILKKEAEVVSLKGVESDRESLHYMEQIEVSTQQWLDQPIGQIDGNMEIDDPFQARVAKHPFIEFIQHVQMDAAGVDISVTSLLNNDAKGFPSVVTMRDIVSNYIYPNTFAVLELTGEDICAALEKSASYFILDQQGNIGVNPSYESPKPQHYNYDMWEGIEYTINVAKPIGKRIEQVTYHGEPLNKEKTYQVVLNNYRASGGGDFDMFKEKPIIKEIQQDAVELIQAYFEKHPIVPATITPNFKVTS
ncbi:bifunctional UDP-sugar hydrolase/5'-nucleotidase [Virgibacillus sp. LDC-1]|uniref:bifunctional metallophosphatase/5'-nucleotidase n=1 Tax=Virgibacillus sp. LDC-1 TaxID=3039856 RepID=UPI0024DECDE4|nr:bifunctional UDP-sugar hydrolase/5'-nucleotidase [Virgibacillus sp. LDC-1]